MGMTGHNWMKWQRYELFAKLEHNFRHIECAQTAFYSAFRERAV